LFDVLADFLDNNQVPVFFKILKVYRCSFCGCAMTIGIKKYCSPRCKAQAAKERLNILKIERKCGQCGKMWIDNRDKKGPKKYCSDECRIAVEANKNRKKRAICQQCGADFFTQNKARYCSGKCWVRSDEFKKAVGIPVDPDEARERRRISRRKREAEKRKNYLKYVLKHRIAAQIHKALKNGKNGMPWEDLLGYNTDDLKTHLQKRFTKGMTWQKFMNGEIHIDHVVPVSAFSFDNLHDSEFKRCWNLKNLQPLWAKENLSKGDRLNCHFQRCFNFEERTP